MPITKSSSDPSNLEINPISKNDYKSFVKLSVIKTFSYDDFINKTYSSKKKLSSEEGKRILNELEKFLKKTS